MRLEGQILLEVESWNVKVGYACSNKEAKDNIDYKISQENNYESNNSGNNMLSGLGNFGFISG